MTKKDPPSDNVLPFQRSNPGKTPSEPVINLPPVVKALCLVLLVIALVQWLIPEEMNENIIVRFGFVSARWSGALPFDFYAALSPLTHMFLHGGWLHVLMNVGMLMAFGAAIEKTAGARRFLALYIACGLVGAFAQFIVNMQSVMPMIGASGAISGLFGAVLLSLHNNNNLPGEKNPKRLVILVGVWILTSVLFGLFGLPGAGGDIAWATHIGGFLAGMLLYTPIVGRGRAAY